MSGQTVYAIASGKGGVGKTTITANLAVAIAELDYDVAIVDLDLGMANLAGWFGVTPSGSTLHTVLAGNASIADAQYDAPGGVTLIPSGTDVSSYADTDIERLDAVIPELRSSFEYVLLDTGAGISHETVRPLGLSDGVLLTTTPREPAVDNTLATIELLDRIDASITGLIVNRTRPESALPDDLLAAQTLLGTLPEDSTIATAHEQGVPFNIAHPDSAATERIRAIAEELTDTTYTSETTPLAAAGLDPDTLAAMDAVDIDDGALLIDLEDIDADLDFPDTSGSRPAGETVLDLSGESDETTRDQDSGDDSDRGGFLSRLFS